VGIDRAGDRRRDRAGGVAEMSGEVWTTVGWNAFAASLALAMVWTWLNRARR
jgi:hypothetical protein